jgi:uncharacterized membrane protein
MAAATAQTSRVPQFLPLIPAFLLVISLFLPWVAAAAGSASGLLIAVDSDALKLFGPERIGLAWAPLAAAAAALPAAVAVLTAGRLRSLLLGLAAVTALSGPVLFLVFLPRMSGIVALNSDADPNNNPYLPGLIGFGLWLALACAFAVGWLALRSLQAAAAGSSGRALDSRRIVVSGLLGAIAVTLGVTGLGFIPVPNLTGTATIMHVPAIIGAVLEGPLVGVIAGAIFGLFSMLQDTTGLFSNPLVSVMPRLLIGLLSWLAFRSLSGINRPLAAAVAGAVGSLANTVGVLGMLVLLGLLPAAVILVILPQAIAEMVLAALLTPAVVAAIDRTRSGRVSADERGPRDKSYF